MRFIINILLFSGIGIVLRDCGITVETREFWLITILIAGILFNAKERDDCNENNIDCINCAHGAGSDNGICMDCYDGSHYVETRWQR